MNLQAHSAASTRASYEAMSPPKGLLDVDSVVLRPLKTHAEIKAVLHLRDEIDLSAHHGAGNFDSLEKKETSWVSSARSSSTETS